MKKSQTKNYLQNAIIVGKTRMSSYVKAKIDPRKVKIFGAIIIASYLRWYIPTQAIGLYKLGTAIITIALALIAIYRAPQESSKLAIVVGILIGVPCIATGLWILPADSIHGLKGMPLPWGLIGVVALQSAYSKVTGKAPVVLPGIFNKNQTS